MLLGETNPLNLYIRMNNMELTENQNHIYHVLHAVMDYNKNIENICCFSFGQVFDFLGYQYRVEYSAYRELLSAYSIMVEKNQIYVPPYQEDISKITFSTCLEAKILPEFYGNSWSKLPYNLFKDIYNDTPPFAKEKFFHIYCYLHRYSFENYNPSVKKVSEETGITRRLTTRIMEYISDNYQ